MFYFFPFESKGIIHYNKFNLFVHRILTQKKTTKNIYAQQLISFPFSIDGKSVYVRLNGLIRMEEEEFRILCFIWQVSWQVFCCSVRKLINQCALSNMSPHVKRKLLCFTPKNKLKFYTHTFSPKCIFFQLFDVIYQLSISKEKYL